MACSVRLRVVLLSFLLTAGCESAKPPAEPAVLRWDELPPLPDPIGFAGPFAGVSGDALIVAGGANFPDDGPGTRGEKVWHDRVFILPHPDGQWQTGCRLPARRGYGVSVTWNDRVVCIGGGDASAHSREVISLRWNGQTLETEHWPRLPRPCANAAGVLLNDVIYLAGGIETPASEKALNTFWALDLRVPAGERRWTELPSWGGPERTLPVMGAQGNKIYLLGGARLYRNEKGEVTRDFLTDAYRYDPDARTWTRRSDMPEPIVAAPSPAIPLGESHLAMLHGDDGSNFFRQLDPDEHPGFPEPIYAYNVVTDRWAPLGAFPKDPAKGVSPPVTAPVVSWRGRWVIPSGEIRPRVRTPRIFWAGGS